MSDHEHIAASRVPDRIRTTLPISALVFTHNEADMLEDCLTSIAFCDEIVVVDLYSSDASAAVALRHGATVIHSKVLPAGKERILGRYIPELTNEWILLTDPDMHVDPTLASAIRDVFGSLSTTVGVVEVPVQFFFAGRPLRGTVWGGVRERQFLYNRAQITFSTDIHSLAILESGAIAFRIPYDGHNLVRHYWMLTYRSWFEKHRRYTRAEASDRYARGERFNPFRATRTVIVGFGYSFLKRHGYRDFVRGLLLSLFWAWYLGAVQWELREHAQRIESRS